MINDTAKYGCILLCGWPPPVCAAASAFIATLGALVEYICGAVFPGIFPQTLPPGPACPPPAELQLTGWVWAGISVVSSVTLAWPAVSPTTRWVSPAPEPCPIGALPCKFGRPNVLFPSPPKFVPSKENKAVFCEIGRSCPLQNAHPLGAKFPVNIRISATN